MLLCRVDGNNWKLKLISTIGVVKLTICSVRYTAVCCGSLKTKVEILNNTIKLIIIQSADTADTNHKE